MRMCRTAVVFFIPILLASAESTTLAPPSLGALPPKQFDQMLRKGLEGPGSWQRLEAQRQLRMASNECSIPLLEYRVKHPEQYTIKRLPVPPQSFDSMAVPPPAPACKNWNK